jgi:hypothetical protein
LALVAPLIVGCTLGEERRSGRPVARVTINPRSELPEAAPARARPEPSPDACDTIRCDRIHRLMEPRQSPPLVRPRAVRATGPHHLRPGDRVIGVSLGGVSRAYPVNVLAYHRAVQDRLGRAPIVIGYSPLTEAVLCARSTERLAASGLVYENDVLLRDEATSDLGSVALGRSVRGERAGRTLARARCAVMSWAAWRQLEPRTTVAWPWRAPRGADYRRDPWAWYRRAEGHVVAPLHFVDLRLPRKLPVVGVRADGEARAFPLRPGDRRAINAKVGAQPLLVLLDGPSRFGQAYSRIVTGHGALTFTPRARPGRPLTVVDAQTGSTWNLLGEATRGPLRGRRLAVAGPPPQLFLGWAAFNPGTKIESSLEATLEDRNDQEERS